MSKKTKYFIFNGVLVAFLIASLAGYGQAFYNVAIGITAFNFIGSLAFLMSVYMITKDGESILKSRENPRLMATAKRGRSVPKGLDLVVDYLIAILFFAHDSFVFGFIVMLSNLFIRVAYIRLKMLLDDGETQ